MEDESRATVDPSEFWFCVSTSAERGSVLSEVLDLCVLPHQQPSELLHLPLQQVAHCQQGAHQLSTHLRAHRTLSQSRLMRFVWSWIILHSYYFELFK